MLPPVLVGVLAREVFLSLDETVVAKHIIYADDFSGANVATIQIIW